MHLTHYISLISFIKQYTVRISVQTSINNNEDGQKGSEAEKFIR